MKPTTARMLEELRQLTNGLVFSTEGDYYVDPFVWESDEQGELTLDKLLEAEGYLEEVEIESVFSQSKQFPREQPVTELFSADKKQLELLSFLQSRCTEVQVYVVSKSDASCKWNRDHPEKQKVMEPFEGFPIILAETKTGEWIGIAPEVHFDCSDNERLFSNYDPFREEGLWSTAFLFRDCLPMRDRADCYVRFDLESLLSKLDVPLQLKSGIAKTVKQRALQLYGEQLPEIAACQNQQISEAILALIAEIKELLMGM
ncbi:MAG: nuclease A inhibitor family protein [Cyanobacteria bacterium P01_H01_bin.162]